MAFETDKNPYYEETVNTFKDCFARKAVMESDFRPDMVQDYAELLKELNKSAIELLKLGVSKKLDGETIIIYADDKEFPVQKKDILKEVGEKQWNVLFPIEELEKSSEKKDLEKDKEKDKEEDDTFSAFKNDYPYEITQNPYQQTNPLAAFTNPLGALLASIFAPFAGIPAYNQQNMYSPTQPAPAPAPAPAPIQKEQPKSDSTSDILNDISGLHRKIVLLEKERDGAQDSVALVKEKYEELKKELNDKIETLEIEQLEYEDSIEKLSKEKDELAEKIKSLEKSELEKESSHKNTVSQLKEQKESVLKELNTLRQTNENLKREKESLNNQLSNVHSQFDRFRSENDKQIDSLKGELEAVKKFSEEKIKNITEKAEEDLKKAEENLKKAVDTAKEEASSKAAENGKNTNRRIQELETRIAEFKERAEKDSKRIEELQGKVKNTQSEKDSAKSENDRLKDHIKKLESELKEAKDKDIEKENFYKDLEKKNSELSHLAYTDQKTKTMNLNAFNRDLPNCDKDNTIIAMVGIRNMKNINVMHGRGSGDNVINMVAEKVSAIYGKENVYRILGDQFVILIKNGMVSNVQNQISSIQESLDKQNIEIAYGISAGNLANNIVSALAAAEEAMNRMKDPATDTGYQMPAMETETIKEAVSSQPEELDMNSILLEYINSQN